MSLSWQQTARAVIQGAVQVMTDTSPPSGLVEPIKVSCFVCGATSPPSRFRNLIQTGWRGVTSVPGMPPSTWAGYCPAHAKEITQRIEGS